MPRTNMRPKTGLYMRHKDAIPVFILLAISGTYACQNNTYGAGCSKKCGHCLNKEQCNHIKGTCHNGCEAGYYSPRCKKECKEGTFGENCATLCGHCKDEEACDKETGACPSGCHRWYEGIYCNQSCQTVYYGPHCVLICNSSCPNEMCYSGKEDCLQENYQRSGKDDCGNMKLFIAIGGSVGVLSVVIHVVALITSNKRKPYCHSGKNRQTSSLVSHKSINCESAQNDNIQSNTCQEEPSTQTSGFYMELMESQYQNTAEHIYEQA
ncbi:scavenger receptor class F member 2 [Magallana gigas]|uniref:scavenger receptor class F member 2 n=1 Tax=Magallana gigas TaxID=29159 RepID=UPI003341943E